MNVGDIFVTLRADGAPLAKDAKTSGEAAGTSAATGFGAKFKSSFSGLKLGDVFKTALGVGGGLALFSGATAAIGGVASALGDATKAAREDDAAQAKLLQTVRANVTAYAGSEKAIDDFIQVAQGLAFTDDDVRVSIGKLLPRTHDLAKAIDLSRRAMDLARLRGIDLASATEIVGKVFSGQVGAARKAGLAIDKHATATEALAAIQKAAAGQAETYANTQEGAAERSSIKWDEAKESLGRAFAGLSDILAAVVSDTADAVTGLLSAIGNIGTAFDNLHRLIDPNYKLMQDTDVALRDLAEQYGFSGDAVVKFTADQKLLGVQQQATIEQNHLLDLQNEIIAANIANQAVNVGALIDKYAQYGISADQVIQANSDLVGVTTLVQSATDQNAAAQEAARLQLIEYAKHVGLTNVLEYANAAATDQQTQAIDEQEAARKKQADDMDAYGRLLEHNARLAEDSATAQNIYNSTLGSGSQTLTDEVVPNYRNAARAIDTAMKTARDKAVTYLGQIPKFASDEMRSRLHLIKDAMAAYKLAITEPVSKAKVIAAIDAKLTSQKLQANLKSHNPQIRHDTQVLVDWLIAERNRLNGTVTFTGRVVAGAPNYIGPGGQGQSGNIQISNPPRANGGPIWPGDWLVGEHGPERMRVFPNGSGYVWPHAGGNASTHHTFGPINVHVDGDVSPDQARELGRGIGDRLGEVMDEMRRMRGMPATGVAS